MENGSEGHKQTLPFSAIQTHLNKLGLSMKEASKELGYSETYLAQAKTTNKVSKTAVIAAEALVRRQGSRFEINDKDLEFIEKVQTSLRIINDAKGKLNEKLTLSVDEASGMLKASVDIS